MAKKEFLTLEEASAMASLSIETILGWARQNKIKATYIEEETKWLIHRQTLINYINWLSNEYNANKAD